MFCKNCGKEIPDGSKFCQHCGSAQDDSVNTETSNGFESEVKESVLSDENSSIIPGDKKTKKKTPLIVTAIIAVIGVALLIILFVIPSSNYNKAKAAAEVGDWQTALEYYSKAQYKDSAALADECRYHIKSDYDFIRALEKSFSERNAYAESDDFDSAIAVKNELEILSSFEKAEFYDEGIAEQAKKYIKGLKMQKSAVGYADDGSSYVNDVLKWDEGCVVRFEAIDALIEKTDLLKDNAELAQYAIGYLDLMRGIYDIDKDVISQIIGVNAEISDEYDFPFLVYTNNTDYIANIVFYNYYLVGEDFITDENVFDKIKPGETVNIVLENFPNKEIDEWTTDWVVIDVYDEDGISLDPNS